MALSKLKQGFVAGAATAALSLGGAFAAHAQENAVMGAPVQQSVSAGQQQAASIPVLNGRNLSDAYLRVTAARDSGDTVVLIVYGNNRELYNRVKQAAQDVTAEGYPVRGIIVANGPEAVEIYADAQSITTHSDPMSVDREGFIAQTRSEIRHIYKDVIIPRREKLFAAQNQPLASAQ